MLAGVGDVVVSHGELPDAVLRVNDAFALLHRQAAGVVGKVRRFGIQDRIVIAAPQPYRDFSGYDAGYPVLERLSQHQRLRIEPATLVEQSPQAASARSRSWSIVSSLWIPDTRPVVGDVQERQTRRFVDPAALRFDDAVFDLVAHAEAVAAADLVRRASDQLDLIVEDDAVDRDRQSFLETDRHFFVGNVDF